MSEHERDALDPRQVRTRAKVLAAARAVLRREGLGGTTMDAVAVEAGVARSTLYRNWPGRDELLAEAFDDLLEPPTPPDPARAIDERLVRVLLGLAHALRSSEWGRTLPAVVAAIDAAPTVAERYGRLTDEHRAAVVAMIRDAIRRGELATTAAADDIVDALAGPIFYRHLVRRVPTHRRWIERHVERTLHGLRA